MCMKENVRNKIPQLKSNKNSSTGGAIHLYLNLLLARGNRTEMKRKNTKKNLVKTLTG